MRVVKNKVIVLPILCIFLLSVILIMNKGEFEMVNMAKNLTIVVVYDNTAYLPNLKADHGFSCVVRIDGKKILFDTGTDENVLLNNLEKLGIRPESISTIILSHEHTDHVGGLEGFLKKNGNVTVYLLASFPTEFKQMIKSFGANVVEVSEPRRIDESVYSTGKLGIFIQEQALVINTPKGLVVITGCAHPGIANIVRFVEQKFGKVYLVVGGFHLMWSSEDEIGKVLRELKELGVEKVMPCHCTGKLASEMFRKTFKENFEECGVGRILKI
ncbi:MAG: MBL fold metallo-hydrolase [Candidatus Aenigmarchaeota archaeon]|nr:MBL fold metallo-hydrolase [Candidatus Aenigmarchaeota archaeon]